MLVEVFEARKEYRLKGYAGSCASMVQQIHYYMTQEFGSIPHLVKQTLEDGRRWIFKSYQSWQEVFPWLTDYAFRKVRSLLVELGIIEVQQLGLRQQGRDRTCWYTVNYDHPFLQQLLRADVEQDNSTDTQVSNSTDAADHRSTTASVECQRIPITTNKTTSNTLSLDVNQTEKKEEARAEATADSSVDRVAKADFPHTLPKSFDGDKSSAAAAELQAWEIAPQQPYPYFLQWRSLHYKNQGGHWANSPQSNAYAEFYKNRFKTNILWQEFLQFYNLALDNALALQGAGITVQLPSCLSEVAPVSERVVVEKAKTVQSHHTPQPRVEIAPDPDFGSKFGALVRQRTLPKPNPEKQRSQNLLQMYLEWLRGDETVLVEEARKKLTRLVMERDDLEADWDDEGKLIDVTFLR